MVSFVSIMQLNDGVASYRVQEQKDFYRAELIGSTSAAALPGELTLSKPLTFESEDPVVNKLVRAIRNTEANRDEVS